MAILDWSLCPAVEKQFPARFHLNREQIVTVLEFAARSLDPSRRRRLQPHQR
jgi:hypothetical protein